MIITTHTAKTSASPAQIWQVWQDVANWKDWDRDLESSRIDGPFQKGTTGSLKFKDSHELKTILTHVEPCKLFIQEAQLPLATVIMTHKIDVIAGRTSVTIQTEICGLFAFFYALLIGRSIRNKVPMKVKAMLKKAESLKD